VSKQLTSGEIMDRILECLEKQRSLSIVSVGQTEAVVLGQDQFHTDPILKNFQGHFKREKKIANKGIQEGFYHRGIRFPNPIAQMEGIAAVNTADIIGYNTIEENSKEITERVFSIYNIEPNEYFEANIRRVFMKSQKEKFEAILRNRKVLLIGSLAEKAKKGLEERYSELGIQVVGALPIYSYEDIPTIKKQLKTIDFDICFLGAGINALILAPYIASRYGKIAFDIGSGMQTFITGEIVTDSWINEIIGFDNLMNM
jgi:hypothetical protein